MLFCFRRPQWLLSFLGSWRQAPSLGPPSPEPLSQEKTGTEDVASSPEEDSVPTISTGTPQNGVLADHDRAAIPPPPPPAIRSPQTDPETTPKAIAVAPNQGVPTFTLSGHDEDSHVSDQPPRIPSGSYPVPPAPPKITPPPSTLMAPPPKPSGLMAPPARPPTLMPPPARPPTLAPLPTSNPRPSPLPSRLQPRQPGSSTLAPPPSHSTKPAKPSRQVVLTPGHSPLDWARLSTSNADLRNLPGGPSAPYLRVTPSMLKKMTGRRGKDAWTVLGGKVYNMSPYLPFHPGGEAELLRGAGRDGTKLFGEVHPWVNYEGMLAACLVGILVSEEEGEKGNGMEEMD